MTSHLKETMRPNSTSQHMHDLDPRMLWMVLLTFGIGVAAGACDQPPVEPTSSSIDSLSSLDGAQASFSTTDEEHSHFRYGTLSWRPLGGGQVEFRLIAAFRRGYSGSGADGKAVTGDIITETIGGTRLLLGDGTETPILEFLVTAHSVSGNWVVAEALNPSTNNPGILHTYANPGPYDVEFDTCCRIFSSFLANRGNGGYRLLTTVSPFDTNRSPVSTQAPIVVVDEAADAQFVVPASDPDGDPITWRLSSDEEAGGGPSPPGLTIDANTGVATWDNVGLDQTRFWTVQVVVEDGTSQTPVDFLLRIQPEVPPLPTCGINHSGPIETVIGQETTFTVTGGPEGLPIEVNSAGLPPGASMNPVLPHSGVGPVGSTFTWTPASGQEGSHPVVFSVSDETGQQTLCSVTIEVEPMEVDIQVEFKDGFIDEDPSETAFVEFSVSVLRDGKPVSTPIELIAGTVRIVSSSPRTFSLSIGPEQTSDRVSITALLDGHEKQKVVSLYETSPVGTCTFRSEGAGSLTGGGLGEALSLTVPPGPGSLLTLKALLDLFNVGNELTSRLGTATLTASRYVNDTLGEAFRIENKFNPDDDSSTTTTVLWTEDDWIVAYLQQLENRFERIPLAGACNGDVA